MYVEMHCFGYQQPVSFLFSASPYLALFSLKSFSHPSSQSFLHNEIVDILFVIFVSLYNI